MSKERDDLFARIAVERGYITQAQLDEALQTQRAVAELGLSENIQHVLVGKGVISHEQIQELENLIAIHTGEVRVVGDYEVLEKLGQGGMGAVYKAKRRSDGLMVALKILPPSLASDTHVARFRREAGVVKTLDHPNIVGYVEFGHDRRRQCYFCALELVKGEDVATIVDRDGPLKEGQTIDISLQIARALGHANRFGLVHRDIKPENFMLTEEGIAKLLDLGLARPTTDVSTRWTQSGMFVGSPDYASPEQSRGEQNIDIRSDIYSLGASMYHMATGEPPFSGGTALEVLRRHQTVKPVPPHQANPKTSRGLSSVILKALAKDPLERYQMPQDLIEDLILLQQGKRPLAEPASSPRIRPAKRKGRQRRSARMRAANWQIAVAGAGAALLLVAIIGFLLTRGGGESQVEVAVPITSLPALSPPSDVPPPPAPPVRVPAQPAVPAPVVAPRPLTGASGKTAKQMWKEAIAFQRANPLATTHSVARFRAIVKEHPNSIEAARAQLRLAEMTSVPPERSSTDATGARRPSRRVIIWQEGEAPEKHTFVRHIWYDDVDYDLFCARDWLSHYSETSEGSAVYSFDVGDPGLYGFWLRANPATHDLSWRLDWEEWRKVDFGKVRANDRINVAAEVDHRFIAWVEVGEFNLAEGTHRIEFRCSGGPGNHGAIDCFCFASDPEFVGIGSRRPAGLVDDPGRRDLDPLRATAGLPPDAQPFGGHSYKLYRPMKWADAKNVCERLGGHLVTIETPEEDRFMRLLTGGTIKDTWIGIEWRPSTARWRWVTGQDLSYANWSPGDWKHAQARGALSIDRSRAWASDRGDRHNYFLCEWDHADYSAPRRVIWDGEHHTSGSATSVSTGESVRVQSEHAHGGTSALEYRCEADSTWESFTWLWASSPRDRRVVDLGRYRKLSLWFRVAGERPPSSLHITFVTRSSTSGESSRVAIGIAEKGLADGAWHRVEVPLTDVLRTVANEYAVYSRDFDPRTALGINLGTYSSKPGSYVLFVDDIAFEN